MSSDDLDFVRLSQEIVDLAQYLGPTDAEKRDRSQVFKELKSRINDRFKDDPSGDVYDIHAFGSYETGLMLPSSDIDVRISCMPPLSPEQSRKTLRRMTNIFRGKASSRMYCNVFYINAKVPVIHVEHKLSFDKTVPLDISIANDATSSTRTANWVKEYHELKPVYLFLKHVLLSIGLADDPAYEIMSAKTSGLAGYSLVCMIVHYIKFQAETKGLERDAPDYVGRLLMGILQFYSTFDYTTQGLQFDSTSGFFEKSEALLDHHAMNKLYIRDPDEPDMNVARSTTTMDRIQAVFAWILRSIELNDTQRKPSLVGSLVSPTWRLKARDRAHNYRERQIKLTADDIGFTIYKAAKNYAQGQKRKRDPGQFFGCSNEETRTYKRKRPYERYADDSRSTTVEGQGQPYNESNGHWRTSKRSRQDQGMSSRPQSRHDTRSERYGDSRRSKESSHRRPYRYTERYR